MPLELAHGLYVLSHLIYIKTLEYFVLNIYERPSSTTNVIGWNIRTLKSKSENVGSMKTRLNLNNLNPTSLPEWSKKYQRTGKLHFQGSYSMGTTPKTQGMKTVSAKIQWDVEQIAEGHGSVKTTSQDRCPLPEMTVSLEDCHQKYEAAMGKPVI